MFSKHISVQILSKKNNYVPHFLLLIIRSVGVFSDLIFKFFFWIVTFQLFSNLVFFWRDNLCVPSSHGGCLRPDPNRRRRREPSFLPDDAVGRGADGDGGSLARFGRAGTCGRRPGFGLPVWTRRERTVDGAGLGTDHGSVEVSVGWRRRLGRSLRVGV